MSIERPEPILLGYRPRQPWTPCAAFGVPDVTAVASASNCLTGHVKLDDASYATINAAYHHVSVASALAAAKRAGVSEYETHATSLFPLMFAGDEVWLIVLQLRYPGYFELDVELPTGRLVTLGYDVVSLSGISEFSDDDRTLKLLQFDCAPLSCNALGAGRGVNQWCLLQTWDDAVSAAREFARDEPEPGWYVIVQIDRVEA